MTTEILIIVHGGMVEEVFSDGELTVLVHDWDTGEMRSFSAEVDLEQLDGAWEWE